MGACRGSNPLAVEAFLCPEVSLCVSMLGKEKKNGNVLRRCIQDAGQNKRNSVDSGEWSCLFSLSEKKVVIKITLLEREKSKDIERD